MTSTRDPYRELLGWQAERAPNYYELLGIPPLANVEPELVQQAAEQLLARVRQQSRTHDAELVSRLMAEVELARKCLRDPQRKAQYDNALRRSGQAGKHLPSGAVAGGSASPAGKANRRSGPSEADLLPPGVSGPADTTSAARATNKPAQAAVSAASAAPTPASGNARRSGQPAKTAASPDLRVEQPAGDAFSAGSSVELPPGLSVELPPGLEAELPVGTAEMAVGAGVGAAAAGTWPAAPVAYAPHAPVSGSIVSPMPAASPVALSTAPTATVLAAKRRRDMQRALALFGIGTTVVVASLVGVVYWLLAHSRGGSPLALAPNGVSASPANPVRTNAASPSTSPSYEPGDRAAGDDPSNVDPEGAAGGGRRGKRPRTRGGSPDLMASPQEGLPAQGSASGEPTRSSAGMAGEGLPAVPGMPAGAAMPTAAMPPSTPAGTSSSGAVPSAPGTAAPGAEARPAPMEPVAPPPTRAEVEKLIKALESARMALSEHQFSAADEHLAQADQLAKTPEQKQAVARVRRLADWLAAFRQALLAQLQSMQGGETIKVGTSTQVTFVEVNENQLIVRMAGMNRKFPLSEVPAGLALAIADLRFRQGDPTGLQAKAAYLIAQKKPTDESREKARHLLQEAQSAGADVSDLLRLLDENYADWLKDVPAKVAP